MLVVVVEEVVDSSNFTKCCWIRDKPTPSVSPRTWVDLQTKPLTRVWTFRQPVNTFNLLHGYPTSEVSPHPDHLEANTFQPSGVTHYLGQEILHPSVATQPLQRDQAMATAPFRCPFRSTLKWSSRREQRVATTPFSRLK